MISLILFFITGIAAVWLGFGNVISRGSMENICVSWVFYFLLISLALWIFATIRAVFRCNEASDESVVTANCVTKIQSFWNNHKLAIGIAAILTILGSFACKPEFRILADETNLLSLSQALYEERECKNYTSVLYYYYGFKNIISYVIDKRPALHPFVVSICHSLFGYRPENIFIVNILSGFFSIFLIYYLISMRFGRFWGIGGMVLLAAYPTFLMSANSGGFEVFNLLFSLILFWQLIRFVKKPTAIEAEALLLVLPLLSQTRYESASAIVCVLPVVLCLLPWKEYKKFSYKLVIWPLLFLPPAWLRIMFNDEGSWQVDKSVGRVFGLDFLWINLKKSLPFFFGEDVAYGMIPAVTFLAIVGLVLTIIDLFFKKVKVNAKNTALFLSIIAFYIFHAAARFAYYWGYLTQRTTSRLGVIFMPLLVYYAIVFIYNLNTSFRIRRSYCMAAIIALLLIYWPVAGQNSGIRDLTLYREFRMVREYLENYFPQKNEYILVADRANMYTPLRYSSVNFKHFRSHTDQVLNNLRNRTYNYMIVIQTVDKSSGIPFQICSVPEEIALETLFEGQIRADQYIRISKYKLNL